jgi:hypothetical protein
MQRLLRDATRRVAQRLVAHTGGGIAPLEADELPIMRHLGNQQS